MERDQSDPVSDGDVGSSEYGHCDSSDYRRCSLSVLEHVSGSPISIQTAADLTIDRLISVICSIAIALSLGEIASIYPTAGGEA